ncbi:uncharacterized protein LOC131228522 isoform X2 [Magnolia sinica]|uniref:uncharacterized protein LOC131228522 isoform X2 n=1 Tax=Magnolia sinica TaxID=86752 RepID=UPI0026585ACC|nr:uncharacterized protein LOC131228522 isoform X2 [Magnolia sinica]
MRTARPKPDKQCDICGDCSFAEAIATCSQCNQVHEHIYCMQTQLDAVPDMWFCEECRSRGDAVPSIPKMKDHSALTHSDTSRIAVAAGSHFDLKLHGPLKKQNVVETNSRKTNTQVKSSFPEKIQVNRSLPVKFQVNRSFPGKLDEDSMAHNGEMGKTEYAPVAISTPGKAVPRPISKACSFKVGEASKVKFIPANEAILLTSGAKAKLGSLGSLLPRASPIHTVLSPVVKGTPASKGCLQKGSSNLSSGHSQPAVLPDKWLKNGILQQPSVKPSKPLHVEKSPSRTEYNPSISERSISVKREDGLYISCPADAQKHVSPLILPMFSEGRLPNHPLPDVLWKGSFEIFDAVHHSVFCDRIQAYRPTIVSHKVCDISKRMPKILPFRLQHRCEIWPRIFLKDCPATTDIALYFFSGEFNSFKAKYIRLVELIEKHDLAMRSCLDGVELLIFTSKQLPMDSQRLNMQIYLWGVFIRSKDAKATSHAQGPPLPTRISYTWDLQDFDLLLEDGTRSQADISSNSNAKEVDMEIDMIGGKDVGRIDIPVPRPVALKSCTSLTAHLNDHGPSSARNGPTNLVGPSEIKREIPTATANGMEQDGLSFPDVPPGFSNPVTSEAAKEKPLVGFGTKKLNHVRTMDVTPCFNKLRDLKDDRCLPEAIDYSDKKAVKGSTKVQSPSKPATPRATDVPPGFTKLFDSNDEYQSSQAALRKGKVVTGSTEVRSPPSRRDTTRVEPTSSGEFLGNPIHENPTLQSLKDHPELQFDSMITSYLKLFPEDIKEETARVHSPVKCTEMQHLLPVNGDMLALSLSRPQYLKDGNNWITELSKECLKQEGDTKELQLSL